jgi:hypothetical protein
MLSSKMKKVAICSLATVICGAGQGVSAHTTVKDSSVNEGSRVFTAFSIPHGCGTATEDVSRPVIAQSGVFPNGNAAIAFRTDTNEPVDLSTIVGGDIPPGAGLVGLSPVLIQDHSVFTRLRQKEDASGRVRGFKWTDGSLQTDLTGLQPFRITLPAILPTSCVKSLKVRVAVANYCSESQRALSRADIWIGRLTPLFDDPRVVSVGFWPTISVNRSAQNPLDPSCGGVGFDVAVEPTDADIDSLLPITGFWPRP